MKVKIFQKHLFLIIFLKKVNYVLNNISFSLNKGEVLGITGRTVLEKQHFLKLFGLN